MAEYLKWDEVIQTGGYKALNADQKKACRDEYFQNVVAPQVPSNDVNNAYKEFIDVTNSYDPDYVFRSKAITPDTVYTGKIHERNTQDKPVAIDIEKTKEYMADQERINNPQTWYDKARSSVYKGLDSSVSNKITGGDYIDYDVTYEPESLPEKVISGVTSVLADTPIFMIGGGVASAPGAFGVHSGLGKAAEIHEQKGSIGLSDIDDIAKATAKGAATGLVVGAAGRGADMLTGKITNNAAQWIASKLLAPTAETASLLASEKILNGAPITAEGGAEALATYPSN